MKLDNNLLRQMIAETLEEIALRKGADQASKHASQDEKKNGKDETKEADALAADKAEKLASLEADKAKQSLGESFQLTKGRLRQIISEELISAKKQGIL